MRARSSLSSATSTSATFRPMAAADCTAMWPRPPMPETTTPIARLGVGDLERFVDRDAGAENRGDLDEADLLRRWPTKFGSARAYSAKPPLTEWPVFFCSWQSASQPPRQCLQWPRAEWGHGTPTRSPSLTCLTPVPPAETKPTPSWPRMKGGGGLTGQSPSAACRSVWQTLKARIATWICSGPGSGIGTSSIVGGFAELSHHGNLHGICHLFPPLSQTVSRPGYGLRMSVRKRTWYRRCRR